MANDPTLVPLYEVHDVYMVLDELPTFGRVWRESSEEAADEATVVNLIANGEFRRPVRVVAFNTEEGWSRDYTVAVGLVLLEMSRDGRALSPSAVEFVQRTTGQVPTLLA
jgi:hypothetical protein